MKKLLLFTATLLFSALTFADVIDIDVTAKQLADKYDWKNETQHDTLTLDGNIIAHVITTATEGNRNGYYMEGSGWRLYQARGTEVYIEAQNGATLESVQLTWSIGKNNGILSSVSGTSIPQDKWIVSDSVLNVSGQTKVCLYIANSGTKTNGQVNISRFRIKYNGVAAKVDPTFKYDTKHIYKRLSEGTLTNILTNTSDGVVSYTSSNSAVATVSEDGTVTLLSEGDAIITAEVTATDKFNAASASYNVYARGEKWNIETFDGAQFEGTMTYYTTPTSSAKPSTATGITWTAYLGSVRDGLSGFSSTCAVIRQRKSTEADAPMAYLISDNITGGIDSIAFRWNSNGAETGNWNIAILINNDTIGKITETAGAIFTDGEQPYFTKGGLKISGSFILQFVNMAEAGGTDNAKRFCIDNIEWISYEGRVTPTDVEDTQRTTQARKVIINGQMYILHNGRYINVLGF